jgi:SAM-dependent methyltransferase
MSQPDTPADRMNDRNDEDAPAPIALKPEAPPAPADVPLAPAPTPAPAPAPAHVPSVIIEKEEADGTVTVVSSPYAPRRPYLDLFLISFLILFFELAAIRWFGSTVVFLTFFTNIVLIACFLGMSVGLLTASRRQNFVRWTIPLTFLSVGLAIATFVAYKVFWGRFVLDVGSQQASPQLIYFGTEYQPADPSKFIVPIEVIAGAFFTLIAVTFVGLGQTMGRAFDSIPNRVLAYTVDVLGSLTGIAVFFAASWFRTSPHVWFGLVMLLLLYFVRSRWSWPQVLGAMGTMFLIAMSAYGIGGRGQVFWSPYYKITYVPQTGAIDTNNIAHQQMHRIAETGAAYALPHLLNRDAGGKPYRDVMIIGAGSGNDVAAALRYGANRIDAVEIDPTIYDRGRDDHPDKPYGTPKQPNPKVTVRLDDGRSFARKTGPGQYDLAVYALVDSLVLHSGYSSIRLESFLFTKQAFEDVKQTLKPGGVFAMYNYYRQGWVIARLATMAREVFGVEPLVISLPYQATITPADNQKDHITFLLVGVPDESGRNPTLDAIRGKFGENGSFRLHFRPAENESGNGYQPTPPLIDPPKEREHDDVGPARVVTGRIGTAMMHSGPDPFLSTQPAAADATTLEATPAATQPTVASAAPQAAAAAAAPGEPSAERLELPTDDWPQLYLRNRTIPTVNLRGMALIAALSVVILLAFAPVRRVRPDGRMFFLGAGFMLLETKGVVHMALLFGSTWVVNSVVFFAILVMILLSNLFVLAVRPRNLIPFYALLIVGLLVNALVPMSRFLDLEPTTRTIASCAVVFLPVFFAGVIFAAAFREARDPAASFGSNVAGIILGGLSEYLSLILGFNYLLLVAIGYYALSAAFGLRLKGAVSGTSLAAA